VGILEAISKKRRFASAQKQIRGDEQRQLHSIACFIFSAAVSAAQSILLPAEDQFPSIH
jgi:hypothetical protein